MESNGVYAYVRLCICMCILKAPMLPGGFPIKSSDMFLLIMVNSIAVAAIMNVASNTAANCLDEAYYSLFRNNIQY